MIQALCFVLEAFAIVILVGMGVFFLALVWDTITSFRADGDRK